MGATAIKKAVIAAGIRDSDSKSGAPGHVFVALQLPDGKWELINSIDGSKYYERASWYSPNEIRKLMQTESVQIPRATFLKMPKDIYSSGLTVFQSWSLNEVPIHSFKQRFDLIASGQLSPTPAVCRFSAP